MKNENFSVFKNDRPHYMAVDDEKTILYDGIVRIIFDDKCITLFVGSEYDSPVSLKKCYDLVLKHVKNIDERLITITVMFEDATSGAVYRYGYGKYWTKIGDLTGFA